MSLYVAGRRLLVVLARCDEGARSNKKIKNQGVSLRSGRATDGQTLDPPRRDKYRERENARDYSLFLYVVHSTSASPPHQPLPSAAHSCQSTQPWLPKLSKAAGSNRVGCRQYYLLALPTYCATAPIYYIKANNGSVPRASMERAWSEKSA